MNAAFPVQSIGLALVCLGLACCLHAASPENASLAPRRPALPEPTPGIEHPIDRIVAAYWKNQGIEPPPLCDDVAFVRRASLDLVGLLPAPEQVEAFADDPSPERRLHFVRGLLRDERLYADHWLSFWNDLLRNDYRGTGYIDGGRKQITAWLYQSLLENKPYDQFVRELISPSAESEGFINGIKWRGRVNASQIREIQFSQNISQVFFGVNMKCASCHDSFIDDWKLDDAYSLAAVFADAPLAVHRCDKETGEMATPRFLFPQLGEIDSTLPKAKRLEQLARLVTHPENGRFSRTIINRIWQRMFGRGIVHPVDSMAGEPWSQDLLDYLATYLVDEKYDLRKLMEHIAASRTYQSHMALQEGEMTARDFVFRGPLAKRMTAEQYLDAVWMVTGAGPGKIDAPLKPPAFKDQTPESQRFIRASLVNCDPLMRSLGRPNREQVVTTRSDLLTTLEALDLSNGEILQSTIERGAERLLKSAADASSDELIESLFLSALSRGPSDAEREAAVSLLGETRSKQATADLLWVVLMLPEFQLIR